MHDFFHLAALPNLDAERARQYAYSARTILGDNPNCDMGLCALSLIAYSRDGGPGDIAALPLNTSFRFEDSGWNGTTALGVIRERWNDDMTAFLAFKAGNANANHNDDDAGDFVLDWKGKTKVSKTLLCTKNTVIDSLKSIFYYAF